MEEEEEQNLKALENGFCPDDWRGKKKKQGKEGIT